METKTEAKFTPQEGEEVVAVKDLRVGDRVVGSDGTWVEVTSVGPFGRGQKTLGINGRIDGAYRADSQVIRKQS